MPTARNALVVQHSRPMPIGSIARPIDPYLHQRLDPIPLRTPGIFMANALRATRCPGQMNALLHRDTNNEKRGLGRICSMKRIVMLHACRTSPYSPLRLCRERHELYGCLLIAYLHQRATRLLPVGLEATVWLLLLWPSYTYPVPHCTVLNCRRFKRATMEVRLFDQDIGSEAAPNRRWKFCLPFEMCSVRRILRPCGCSSGFAFVCLGRGVVHRIFVFIFFSE